MSVKNTALRLYRLSLHAFPPRHRQTYAAEMIDAFEQELDRHRANGSGRKAMAFAAAACSNVVTSGLGERRRQRRVRLGPAFSSLDATLAWRMLVRYPGLSIIAVFGMSVGIAIAAGAFTVVSAMLNTKLPLHEGDRIVSLLNWDASTNNRELRLLHDFTSWRNLSAVQDIGLTRTVDRNLIVEERAPETIRVAEISASAFRVARVPAYRGRHLLDDDERAGAPDTIVIGYDEWVRRFGRDPGIIGRSVQLGSTAYTVVGVMPTGFAFPVNHRYWIPWRLDASAYPPRSGPTVTIFGRLAPGVTMDGAQAELAAIGSRLTAEAPATHQHLRARVVPYAHAFTDMDDPETAIALHAIQISILLLLVVVCVNVAILVYARTATREGEIAVRGALGASRLRIVSQLFMEALLLAGLAAAAGLAMASIALRRLETAVEVIAGRRPFWLTFELSSAGVLYIVGLTLMAAGVIGIIPALKATGLQAHAHLQVLSPGSGSRMQMGRLWTALIVAQVAFTVAVLPASLYHGWSAISFRTGDPGFASSEFLTARLVMDRSEDAPGDEGERRFRARFAAAHLELERRLRADAAVSDVAYSMAGVGDEQAAVLEIEGRPVPIDPVDYNIVEGTKSGHLVRFNRVSVGLFTAFDVPVTMGRGFRVSDTGPGASDAAPGVLVNRTVVDALFGGASPLGSRIRYVGRSREADPRDVVLGPWYEIVGVVPDFPTQTSMEPQPVSRVYHPARHGDVYPVTLAVRVRHRDPSSLAGTLREMAVAADPGLQLRDLATAEAALKREQGVMRLIGVTVVLVMLSVVVLSAAGIYAMMSFTVARRRREIGIRAALGASRNRLLAGIFSRAAGQLAAGVALGIAVAAALEQVTEGDLLEGRGAWILPTVVVLMTMVGLLAALGPAREGLRIEPTEALRDE